MTVEEAKVLKNLQRRYKLGFTNVVRDKNRMAQEYYRGAMDALKRLYIVLEVPEVG